MALVMVEVDNLEQLKLIKKKKVDGFIFSIKDLAVNSNLYLDMDLLKKVIKEIDSRFQIWVSLNKIMHNKDLKLLERCLIELNKLGVKRILFYDLAVLRMALRLGINIELVVFQDHLNASTLSNNFYYKQGVKYSLITNDITLEEVMDINDNSKMGIGLKVYGYLPIFYSRRYLISSYLEYIHKDKKKELYYIKHDDSYYPIVEEDYGTTVYTKDKINLVRYLNDINKLDFMIIDGKYIDNDDFVKVIDSYLNKDKGNNNDYLGFSNIKTTYRVKSNE